MWYEDDYICVCSSPSLFLLCCSVAGWCVLSKLGMSVTASRAPQALYSAVMLISLYCNLFYLPAPCIYHGCVCIVALVWVCIQSALTWCASCHDVWDQDGCSSATLGGSILCTFHGGRRPCLVEGCDKPANLKGGLFCKSHGGSAKACQAVSDYKWPLLRKLQP